MLGEESPPLGLQLLTPTGPLSPETTELADEIELTDDVQTLPDL